MVSKGRNKKQGNGDNLNGWIRKVIRFTKNKSRFFT